jgi:hypothetical protein
LELECSGAHTCGTPLNNAIKQNMGGTNNMPDKSFPTKPKYSYHGNKNNHHGGSSKIEAVSFEEYSGKGTCCFCE